MSHPILSVDDFMIGNVKVEHQTSTLQSQSVNWHTTNLSRGIHRLVVDFEIMLTDDVDVKKYEVFYLACEGKANLFIFDTGNSNSWSNPFYTQVVGKHTLSVAASIGTKNITLTGNLSGITPSCKIQIGAGAKVYTVRAVNGQSLEVYPNIRVAFPSSTPITFSVKPLLRLKDDQSGKIGYGSRGNTISLAAYEVMQ
ncbi:hypothetical protein [Aeromonas hydrophila]|uniref:hypothetical protein n=1 Tax=Aeromonas hydrophila TaxID=644 RepID=UPI002B467FFD|nr:hypothetical protein [Aeromonas hydrophila]